MIPAAQTDKRETILHSAIGQFMAYGFSRVTMDDIAQAAGMSRPALYQFFRNKQAIYEAGATAMLDQSLDVMQAALNQDGSPKARIGAAITRGILDMMGQMEATPHGAELIDMKGGLSSGWLDDWKARKIALLAPVYEEAGARAPLDGAVLATQLSDWLEGMKMRVKGGREREEALERFLAMQMAALSAAA
ncbi:TetR family transcriptional regulator [Zhengella mangrovi]|uniref:TetR family transcriptional regulator n=1 Tax=Zhengella mangrovi TaxID=1982044 RepID=A0A2G1QKN7_9HYPH|nr:TetR/AcrR family transcriptional regulator [Zhengella mangrovi]PHP66062.1 TetR family transcriptional regulator [Zhengella mangrovi]